MEKNSGLLSRLEQGGDIPVVITLSNFRMFLQTVKNIRNI
nr:MAG TPA: hypothetical protein [Caudoviricetes sp.]DAM40578.1 MAG TPA: hypothetical protein [Caudoviricetes sp.]